MNLQFHIACDGDDPVAGYLDDLAKANDMLNLEGPVGNFVLNENSPNSLVFIAEGIGFASIKGLIEHAMALDAAARIYLFWIAADEDPPYLNNLCRAWNDALDNFDYVPLTASAARHIDDALLEHLPARDLQDYDYYVCGGEGLREGMDKFAEGRTIPGNQLLYEAI